MSTCKPDDGTIIYQLATQASAHTVVCADAWWTHLVRLVGVGCKLHGCGLTVAALRTGASRVACGGAMVSSAAVSALQCRSVKARGYALSQ